ncbi:hypothetical protein CEP54_003914 [Fusarium duplospermum]|uniref:Ankyrin n=1 Tax=Fusarium duplospermum TaxID=1325734 RepID=A0A428QM04_9HYPO|nr:hypothetical protein CEP54_003914 [Fusarium duplospermum]
MVVKINHELCSFLEVAQTSMTTHPASSCGVYGFAHLLLSKITQVQYARSMADPLSLAASIAGLISLADVTFKYLYKFIKAAKDAKDEVQNLTDQVNDLARVLRVLEALAESLEADGERFDPALRNHYLSHCDKTLEKVRTRVSKAIDSFSSGSKSKSLVRQLKWPFSASETTALLNEISNHKATINLALSADSMRKLQLSLSKTSELSNQVKTIEETVKRIEINTLIEVDRNKRRILDFFMAVNPQPNLETSVRLRHPLTGLWLTESSDFDHWLHTPDSRLWLTGIPGAGKTILAGSVIQEALAYSHDVPGIGAAFFFCDYKDTSTWKTTNILGAIASQLARQKEEAFAILCQYYEELNPLRGLTGTPDSDELRARIGQMSEHFDQTIIVIDGLDECGDETEDAVDMLREMAEYSERVSMALFSRDHFNIRIRLDQDYEIIPISAKTEDVRLFVNAELEKRIKNRRLQLNDLSMKSEITEILVNRAEGMFRWVVCQLDYLCDCAHDGERREALEKLPPDLPESYRRLLERVSRASTTVQSMVHMCLSFIAFAKPKLNILQLRQAVSTPSTPGATLTERNTVSEEEILRRCSSLIRKSQNGKLFEFAHFTVQEFLEDRVALGDIPGIGKFLISKPSSHMLLATQCLRFLQLENFEREPMEDDEKQQFDDEDLIRTRNKQYPFYPYSSALWMFFTRDGLEDPTLFNLARGRRVTLNTAIIAAVIGDVTPIEYLLSSGVVPDEKEIPIFSECLREMDRTNAEAKSSMISLLRYLTSESVGTKEWAKELGSVVSRWCIKAKLSFSDHDTLFDTQLSTSRDNLPARMIQGIINDDGVLVKRYLAGTQLDVAGYRYNGGTLLHLASKNDACDVFELLVDAGCDPYCEDVNGSLPVHVHDSKSGIRFYETLKRLGITLWNPDPKGMTIWHNLAQARTLDEKLFRELIQLDREGTCRALRTRTLADETLLSIVLRPWHLDMLGFNSWDFSDDDEESQSDESTTTDENVVDDSSGSSTSSFSSSFGLQGDSAQKCAENRAKRERMFFSLLDVCSELSGFWLSHGPVMGAAASLGSANVIRRLVEAGAEFEPAVEGTRTPLHELSSLMPLEEAQLLLDAYHYSVEYKFRGRLPVEMYIRNALREHRAPNAQVIETLTNPCVLQNQDAEGKTLWEFVCRLADQINSYRREKALVKLIDNVMMTMLGLRAMQVYEERIEISGITLALDIAFQHGQTLEGGGTRPSFIAVDTVREMLRQTRYWESTRNSCSVQQFFKMAIRSGDLEMVELLLKHEVDIHHRTNGSSPIEEACCPSYRCEAEAEKPMLQLLVDYCKSDNLNVLSPKDGLGLLHKLALRSDATNTVWLMETLIRRGANVNVLARDKRAMSVLAFHLENKSMSCVELLLRQGADPWLGSRPRSSTALSIALKGNNVRFLRQLLSYTTDASSAIDWGRPMEITVQVQGQGKTVLKEANALHFAAANGSVSCLRFLLDENLIKTEVSKSKEGWTPLHASAYLRRFNTTEFLISKGFNVMAENDFGQTPLHLVACRDSLVVVEVLRKHGASESLDDFGKSPRDYAQERHLVEIVNYFEAWRNEVGNWSHLSRKQPKRLAAALGRAIEAGDLKYCQNLVTKGFPIDVILPRTEGYTPLILALKRDKLEIAKLFLDNKASTLKSIHDSDGTQTSIIEMAASKPNFNSLLSAIVDSYCKDGGDLVHGLDFPLHEAVWSGNTEGIDIVLQALEKLEQDALVKPYPGWSCRQVLQVIVNRRRQTRFLATHAGCRQERNFMVTALHVASWKGDKRAASTLVERGAVIDSIDCNSWTPLIYARTVDMAAHLISLGASPAMIGRRGPLPWLMSWSGAEDLPFDLISKLPRQLILNSHPLSICDDPYITPRHLAVLRQLGGDLTLEDDCGRSLMHCIICEDEVSQLVLEDQNELLGTTPFPWHLDWRPLHKIAFLTTKFRDFQQKVPRETFRAIANLEPQRGWSPLCRAAALNLVGIMDNCLEIGAQLDYEGCSVGSAIMLASACGSLEAVKLLVRRGASVCYFGKNGLTSCYVLAGTESIKSWLLSGRFMDQRRITAEGGGGEDAIRPWSGLASARVKIYGKREKYQAESMLAYAKRLALIKKELGGQLVRAYEVSLPEDGQDRASLSSMG